MGVFWKALDELNPNMMLLLISGRLVFEILKDKDVNKRFRVKIVDFQVAKTALHLVRGDLL